MRLRRDALAAAAEWIVQVETTAWGTPGLVATVGRIDISPGASNVIAGDAKLSLDVRHPLDILRKHASEEILDIGRFVASRRGLVFECSTVIDQPQTSCDRSLVEKLEDAARGAGYSLHRMSSGAGHDAMIMAARMPMAMLFVRSPGGVSHHPDETVYPDDVDAALNVGLRLLESLERDCA